MGESAVKDGSVSQTVIISYMRRPYRCVPAVTLQVIDEAMHLLVWLSPIEVTATVFDVAIQGADGGVN